ncbi:thioesterase family protein [Rathayibacter sp. VKM Ac-2801]|uniref:acyl-CoA thioesterase n=1 Tax=Rathayibacter sp. VKM Ac-2801 TaxID=2609255 RepID=UPI00131F5A03|nr:thioesterase family protein [Rathayibacter sp. VKM Ac-2801]QHC70426.1 acyl-CoA thioesterase [Rathayibacter sp. VKM Ac-2801]
MRLHVAIPLRWSDFDAYAHVNNAEMLRLLEEARIQAFWKPDSPQPGGMATAVLDARPGAESISLIARQEIEYLAPIPYMRAPIDVELWIGRIGGASLEVCYELYSPAGVVPRVLFTKAATTLVLVTAATGRPQRIPEELREAWGPYVEEPITFSKRN